MLPANEDVVNAAPASTRATASGHGGQLTVPEPGEGGILTGWLEKRADWKMVWNRRLFCLKGNALSYRESAAHRSDKNCIYVSGLERISDEPTTFRVQHEGGGWWLLKAANVADCNAWVTAIEQILSSTTRNDLVVSGTVDKLSDWMHQWRSRYIVVRGCELAYSETPTGAVKKRYIIVAADPNPHAASEIRIACTSGDAFMIRLPSEAEADLWTTKLRGVIRSSMAWRWQAVGARAVDEPKTLRYLRSSNHGSVLCENGNILVFGGTTTLEDGTIELHNELTWFEPACEHRVYCTGIEPFMEGVGARVRPAAREAHAMAILNNRMYLHGGCDKTAVLSDMWMVNLRNPQMLNWVRLTLNRSTSETLLPGLCGHTMSAQPESGRLIVIGGLDVAGMTSASTIAYTPTTHSCETLGNLTQPRCRHGTAVLSDGHIVVVGGLRSRSNSDVHTTIDMFSPRKQRWREAKTVGTLPPMISPAVATQGLGAFVFGGDGREPARLHFLHYQLETATVVIRELPNLGSPPKLHYGMSAHVTQRGAFVYLIGDSSTNERGVAVHRVMLPAADSPDASELDEGEAAEAAAAAAQAAAIASAGSNGPSRKKRRDAGQPGIEAM